MKLTAQVPRSRSFGSACQLGKDHSTLMPTSYRSPAGAPEEMAESNVQASSADRRLEQTCPHPLRSACGTQLPRDPVPPTTGRRIHRGTRPESPDRKAPSGDRVPPAEDQ